MSHEVESMMFTSRQVPWHGLGKPVENAPSSQEALILAGLDWDVSQRNIYLEGLTKIEGFKANVRSMDEKLLGIVSDRYRVVQNIDAFAFTDALLGEGVRYETAGSLSEGKRIWLLARMPQKYKIAGDNIDSYVVFFNSHDGSSGVKVAVTGVRVVCSNTLSLALHDAKRIWSINHVGDIKLKLDEARRVLLFCEQYMDRLKVEAESLYRKSVTDRKVEEFITSLIPMPDNPSRLQENNIDLLRTDLKLRYYDAPDLQDMPKNAWRAVNAVSDFVTHVKPLRRTENYQENLFAKTIEGNAMLDKAYELLRYI